MSRRRMLLVKQEDVHFEFCYSGKAFNKENIYLKIDWKNLLRPMQIDAQIYAQIDAQIDAQHLRIVSSA